MKTTNYCIITTSIDDENIADKISTSLLQNHLVACVQSHTVQSKYHWNGTLESNKEILLQMKTKTSLFEEVKVQIEAMHSYDLPEIIMTPIIDANKDYLNWIEKEVQENKILNSKHILFVCLGNICRSPLGEGIAQNIIDQNDLQIKVDSAGTSARYTGEQPCEYSIKIAKHHDLDISRQKARPVTKQDINKFDYVLAMDEHTRENLIDFGFSNVYKLGDFGDYKGADVPDPYFFHSFEGVEEVFEMVDACVKDFFKIIEK